MILAKVELALALFNLAFFGLNVLTRDSMPHFGEQPTCVALEVLLVCSHLFFAAHNVRSHADPRGRDSAGGDDGEGTRS